MPYYLAGTIWTTSSHIITAVVGSGVLSLAWAIAQMGWIAGPAVMILFSIVTLYTSSFLADCYRTGDPIFGKRNYTFMDAVSTILGMIHIHINMNSTIRHIFYFGIQLFKFK